MAHDYYPVREADIVTWSANFGNLIAAAPGDYGLSGAQATAYQQKHDVFVAAHQLASDPGTRTPAAVVAKRTARRALEAEARMLARIIQAHPAVSAQQKAQLGLTVRDTEPTPVPVPSTRPVLSALGTDNWTVRIRLADEATPTRRARPAGADGANIFSFVGANPPPQLSAWEFEGQATRREFVVSFPPALLPGAKVWICACWYNSRGQMGPMSASLGVHLAPGIAMAA